MQPCRPQPRPRPESKFDTRPTTLDAFQGMPGRAAKPIYPKSNGGVFDVNAHGATKYETTSRTSYVEQPVQPYVAAIKPKNTLDAVS